MDEVHGAAAPIGALRDLSVSDRADLDLLGRRQIRKVGDPA
jgi:hypothetical protein